MKFTLALIALALSASAHAYCGCKSGTTGGQTALGHNAAGIGARASANASTGSNAATGQSGQSSGLSYFSPYMGGSAVDPYQPWPQSEMRQFQKP